MNQPLDHIESTFNQWWETLSANEQKVLQRHNALFVWKQANEDNPNIDSIKIGNYYLGPIKPNGKIKLFNEYGEGGDFSLKKLETLIDTFFCNEF